jgi:hypothetical protein
VSLPLAAPSTGVVEAPASGSIPPLLLVTVEVVDGVE